MLSSHLKTESCYDDFFDLGTIENCLRSIESYRKAFQDRSSDEKIKNLSKEKMHKGFSTALNLHLYVIKGERYRIKKSTIHDWVERDRRYDEKLANAQEPRNILCPNCTEKMKITFKDLYDLDIDSLRVLFFFECPICKKRKGIFDNGEEFVSRPQLCPKCNKKLTVLAIKDAKKIHWDRHCTSCDFKDVEIDDFDKEQAEREKKHQKDQEFLKKYRTEFCLSEEEGQEYIVSYERLKQFTEYLDRTEKKRADPDYQKALKLKKLTIVELEKLLSETLEKEKYTKLSFDKPEIGKHVIVPFVVQDADAARKENDSICKLRRVIRKILEGSNWRLMSEGITYRLGYLSGRLKGYEQEEDLMQIVKSAKQDNDF